MKKFIVIILIILAYQFSYSQGYHNAIEKARFLIKEHQKQTNIPGIQVALMVGDSLVWSEGFGFSAIATQTPVNRTTRFRIASVSKSLTSVVLGKLIEKDQIDIDTSITFYLPEFPKKSYPLTCRQLASSTSGIRHYTAKDSKYNNVNYPTIISSLDRFKQDPLLFEPGTDYHYSSYGWVLLSAVMEKASNKSFIQLMEESWSEIGMTHTSFDFPNKTVPNKSVQYVLGKNDTRQESPTDNRSYMYAGGGYLSTAEDLALLGNNLLNYKYINSKTTSLLFTSFELKDGPKTNYGLGWECGTNRTNTPVVYHSGSMSSARAHLVLLPEEDLVFAYIANTGENIFFNDREAHSIAELFLRESILEENIDLILGEWEINTTSLRNKKTKGVLNLEKNNKGIVEGSITFKRSKKKETYPITLAGVSNNQFHFIGVTPMFLDLYLTVKGNTGEGRWLHDFNVNGIPESDEYWKPRVLLAKKKIVANNK